MKNLALLLLVFSVFLFAQNSDKKLADSAGYQKMAFYSWDTKDYKTCINANTMLIKLNPKNLKAYTFRASAEWAIKDYTNAINDFTVAIKLDEKYAWIYYNDIALVKVAENDLS